MRELKQIRWIGTADGSKHEMSNVNSVNDLKIDQLNGAHAIQIGIQAPEGTIFYTDPDFNRPIAVGRTGVFEWTVEGTGAYITHFAFGGTLNNKNTTYIADFYLVSESASEE